MVRPFDLFILSCYYYIDMNKNRSSGRHYRNPYHGRAYLSIGNNSISVTRLEYRSAKIDEDLSGFKIVHVSDLHNHKFGDNQYKLINRIREEHPDIIVVTGDLIDRRRIDINIAMAFIREAVKAAPVFYVTGNHEIKSSEYKELYLQLKTSGAAVMDNESKTMKYGGGGFELIGLRDASSFCSDPNTFDAPAKEKILNKLKNLTNNKSSRLNVLLTHRPELIDIYSKCGADLVFSGHAHGGQMRLPFLGGLYAPGQGIPPKYTSGMYICGSTALVVSRGLGNSLFPLRIFNPPEIVALTLKNKQL